MKIVLQRVSQAKVTIKEKIVGEINQGYVILLGVGKEDSEETVKSFADKVMKLRAMSDKQGKMNKSILDVNGEILIVSQFTLYANTKGGRRPSFINAAPPDKAKSLYEMFIEELKRLGVEKVANGEFGAYMSVSLINDGPVTIILNSNSKQ